jgi:uncharacterized protein (TIGR03435 family)
VNALSALHFNYRRLLTPVALICSVCTAPAFAQDKSPAPAVPATAAQTSPAGSADTANPAAFSYEVVSIKPYKQSDAGMSMWWRTTPDGFSSQGFDLADLIRDAYDIVMDDQLTGLPPWANSERYSVDAKMDEESAAAIKRLPPDQRGKIQDSMLQAVLADRFQLKLHTESRELPIYNLVTAKGGPKLTEAPKDKNYGYSMGPGRLSGTGVELDSLAYSLSNEVGRLIVNKTGLTGKYTIDLKWQPDSMAAGSSPAGNDALPDLFTALEEQLGLKLESAKGPVDVYIVDHAEKPSEN